MGDFRDPGKTNGQKSSTEKIEFVMKLWTSFVITVAGIAMTYYTNQISNSLKQNEVFEKLIDDLCISDTVNHYRKQLALIALNELYKDRKDSLLVKITNTVLDKETNGNLLSTARDIASSLDTNFAKRPVIFDQDQLLSLDNSHMLFTVTPALLNDNQLALINKTRKNTNEISNQITKYYKKAIVLFMNKEQTGRIDKAKMDLEKMGIYMILRDKPDDSPDNEIYYFHDSDNDTANELQKYFGDYLKIKKKNIKEINKGQVFIYFRDNGKH